MHRDKSAKMAIWQKIAILALLSLGIDFKNEFTLCVMKGLFKTLLLKKCLRPYPGPFLYLSERINWIISSLVNFEVHDSFIARATFISLECLLRSILIRIWHQGRPTQVFGGYTTIWRTKTMINGGEILLVPVQYSLAKSILAIITF